MDRRITLIAMILIVSIISISGLAWYTGYTYRYSITQNVSPSIFSVNDTYGIKGNIYWTYATNNAYVYSTLTNYGNVIIGNDTGAIYWENESNLGGNNQETLWSNQSAVAIWHFSNSSGGYSDSSNRVDCDLVPSAGFPTNATSKFGRGIATNNTGYYVQSADSVCMMTLGAPSNFNYSISMWFRGIAEFNSSVAKSCLLTDVNDNSGGIFTCLDDGTWGGAGKLIVGWNDGNYARSTTTVWRRNTWYNAVVVYDGAGVSIYVNGTNESGLARTTPFVAPVGIDVISIGARAIPKLGLVDSYYNGEFDEVRIYNRSLSSNEIWSMYFNGINNFTQIGAETQSPPLLVYNITANNTYYYPNKTFSSNFTVNGTTIGQPFLKFSNGATGTAVLTFNVTANKSIYNYNITPSYNKLSPNLQTIIYNVRQENSLTNYTNTTQIFVYSGVNITDYRSTNGTVWSGFYWKATSGANTTTGQAGVGKYINSTYLPVGVTAFQIMNDSEYTNGTFSLTLNSTPYFLETSIYSIPLGNTTITSFTSCDGRTFNYFNWTATNSTGSHTSGSGTVGTAISSSVFPIGTFTMSLQNQNSYWNQTKPDYFNATVIITPSTLTTTAISNRYLLMNFTVKDEYETGNPNIYFDLSISNTTNSSSSNNIYNFTGYYQNIPMGLTNIALTNSTGEYVLRNYYTTIGTCSHYNNTLYMLKLSEGQYVRWHVLTSIGSGIVGADVLIEKLFTSYETVEDELTDGSGVATTWLNPDTTYRVTVSKSGYTSYQSFVRPSGTDYYIYLGGSVESYGGFMYDNMAFSWTPSNFQLNQNNYAPYQYSINYTITSYDSLLSWHDLRCVWNSTTLYINNSSTTPSGMTYNANFNITGNISIDNHITCYSTFSKFGFTINGTQTKSYSMFNYPIGNYTIFSTMGFADAEVSDNAWGFIIIILSIVAGISIAGATSNYLTGAITTVGVMCVLGIVGALQGTQYINPLIPMFSVIGLFIYVWVTRGK